MVGFIILIYLWFGQRIHGQTTNYFNHERNYRCAIYEIPIDFSNMQSMVPGQPLQIISYAYIIEYGEDVVLEIKDPGPDKIYLPVTKAKWNYKEGRAVLEFFLRHNKKFYSKLDSIMFSIDEFCGRTQLLTNQNNLNSVSDTIVFTSLRSNKEWLLFIEDTIQNIRSRDLFYPVTKFLPVKIERKSAGMSNWYLQNVLYGKLAVDSLLSTFDFTGYDRITEEEMINYNILYPIEQTKSLISPQKE